MTHLDFHQTQQKSFGIWDKNDRCNRLICAHGNAPEAGCQETLD